jgi:3',5'-cyclic AMP phosphodiesterase CpdA
MDCLFSWVHISDIHFGHGDRSQGWDQQMVTAELSADISRRVAAGYPAPRRLFLTGDIAFSGATRSANEYADAKTWLEQLRANLNLAPEAVLIIPGNHDVQRSASQSDRNLARLLRSARDGDENLVDLMAVDADRGLLGRRIANFLDFAATYGPQPRSEPFYWSERADCASGFRVRIACLNSSMLCDDDTDYGKLQLGNMQIDSTLLRPSVEPGELVVLLTHHPFDWLRDGADAEQTARKFAHVHLCGHIHSADVSMTRSGGGSELIRIVAGAAHETSYPGAPPSRYGYSFGSIHQNGGDLELRYWPRLWSPKNRDFRIDIDNVPDGEDYAVFPLRVKVAAPLASKRTAVPQPVDDMAGAGDAAERVSLLLSIAEGWALIASERPRAIEMLVEAIDVSGEISDHEARVREMLNVATRLMRLGATREARLAASRVTQTLSVAPAIAPGAALAPAAAAAAAAEPLRELRICALCVTEGADEQDWLQQIIRDMNSSIAPALGMVLDFECHTDQRHTTADLAMAIMAGPTSGAGVLTVKEIQDDVGAAGGVFLCFARSDAFADRDQVLRDELARTGRLFTYDRPEEFGAVARLQITRAVGNISGASSTAPAGSTQEQVARLSREYDAIRQQMPSGPARTLKMESVLMQMRQLAAGAANLVERLKLSDAAGDRLMAIAIAEMYPSCEHVDWLGHRFDHSAEPPAIQSAVERSFIQYHAALALRAMAKHGGDCRPFLEAAVAYALKKLRYLDPKTDRVVVLKAALQELKAR